MLPRIYHQILRPKILKRHNYTEQLKMQREVKVLLVQHQRTQRPPQVMTNTTRPDSFKTPLISYLQSLYRPAMRHTARCFNPDPDMQPDKHTDRDKLSTN